MVFSGKMMLMRLLMGSVVFLSFSTLEVYTRTVCMSTARRSGSGGYPSDQGNPLESNAGGMLAVWVESFSQIGEMSSSEA